MVEKIKRDVDRLHFTSQFETNALLKKGTISLLLVILLIGMSMSYKILPFPYL